MSYEEIHYRKVIGRNEYSCVWCGEKILKKEKHVSRVYKFDGDFHSDRLHLECEDALGQFTFDELSDGFTEGEFKRGSTESK
jgi:hypothetical protein